MNKGIVHSQNLREIGHLLILYKLETDSAHSPSNIDHVFALGVAKEDCFRQWYGLKWYS